MKVSETEEEEIAKRKITKRELVCACVCSCDFSRKIIDRCLLCMYKNREMQKEGKVR